MLKTHRRGVAVEWEEPPRQMDTTACLVIMYANEFFLYIRYTYRVPASMR